MAGHALARATGLCNDARAAVVAAGEPADVAHITARMRQLRQGVVHDPTVPVTKAGGAGGGRKPPTGSKVAGGPSWEDRFRRPADTPGAVTLPDGLLVGAHEMATARRLARFGADVAFRPLSHEYEVKNPDVEIDGQVWEFKSPKGSSEKSTIVSQFKRGRHQAANLVIDLARCGLPDNLAISQIRHRFDGQRQIRQLVILDHEGNAAYLSR